MGNLGGALQTWCPSKNACTARSACPEKPCMGMDSHGCNGCDGESWCESSGKCQYASIYCPQEPTPKIDKACINLGGALQTWCPSKNACTKRSACPEKPCMGMDSHGCNRCDGESWCESRGTCQYASIYCPQEPTPKIDTDCTNLGGALQTWCP